MPEFFAERRDLFLLIAFVGSLVAPLIRQPDKQMSAIRIFDCLGSSCRGTTTSASSLFQRKTISPFRVAFPQTWNAKRRRTESSFTANSADIGVESKSASVRQSTWTRIHIATLTDGICPGAGRIDQKVADVVDGIHYDEEMEFLVVRLSSKHKGAVYEKRGKFA